MQTLKLIKVGGQIIDDGEALPSFIYNFAQLKGPKLLIHGGGNQATKVAKQMNIRVKMNEGRRITDSDTLDVITMVYAGKLNKNIVARLQANNCNAVGFTGADGNTIVSEKRPIKPLDYGFVGDIKDIKIDVLELLLNHDIVPVFCAITHDENGQLLNTNADTVASALAIAFAKKFKTELYYCFEKSGVLNDIEDETSVIETITEEGYQHLKAHNIIAEGMLPKLDNCFNALNNQVFKVCIGKPEMLFKANTLFTTIQK